MNFKLLIGMLILTAPAVTAIPAAAQAPSAEVRTWSGKSWRLTNPSLELFYTLTAPKREEGTAESGAGGKGSGAAATEVPLLFGSKKALNSFLDKTTEPLQGHKQSQVITLYREGVARQLPLFSIAALFFTRQSIPNSPLPPYVAPTHFRYSATALLKDGSRVEGDYINLATAVLRGSSGEERVDIPWQEIETVSFHW